MELNLHRGVEGAYVPGLLWWPRASCPFKERSDSMRLCDVATGLSARIASVSGDDRFVSRVTAIGLTEGCAVEVLQNVRNRPVLVHVRDSDVALDRGDCMRIEVEVVA